MATSCIKAMKSKSPTASTRLWCTYVGAALLTLHAELSALASRFLSDGSSHDDQLKGLRQWQHSMPLPQFLSVLQEVGGATGTDECGGQRSCWYTSCVDTYVMYAYIGIGTRSVYMYSYSYRYTSPFPAVAVAMIQAAVIVFVCMYLYMLEFVCLWKYCSVRLYLRVRVCMHACIYVSVPLF